MNITVKSLISDLEELVQNNVDIAPLARDVLDKYRDELPGVEHSVAQLVDEKYQMVAKNIMQDIENGDNTKCRFGELIRSTPFFVLKTIDLTKRKDNAGNDTYLFTVAADNNTRSPEKASIECKFYLYILTLNEPARSQVGANRTFPFVESLSLTIGEKSLCSLSLIDVRDGCIVP